MASFFFESSQPSDLSNLVILKPQWLINNLTLVLCAYKLHTTGQKKAETKNVKQDYEQLMNEGIASGELLDKLWDDDGSKKVSKFMTQFMGHMSLMCKRPRAVGSFLVPAVLPEASSE